MTRGDLVWTVEKRGDVRLVAPAGRVDEASATAFAERLAQEIASAAASGAARLAIDLATIDYMSSRGLRGLTLAQRQSSQSGIAIVLAVGFTLLVGVAPGWIVSAAENATTIARSALP